MTRLIVYPHLCDSGAIQMAADELLLRRAESGQASFRFYTWSPPTLSLGYFQPMAERLKEPHAATLPWVRRATGGGAIPHGHDLTYAIALPPPIARRVPPAVWHKRIHLVMVDALAAAKIEAALQPGARKPPQELGYLCFAVPQPDDVVSPDGKIIGSAQRLRHGALLQHGSIFGPARAIMELVLPQALSHQFGWELDPQDWTPADLAEIEGLAAAKFSSREWNERR